MKKNILIAAVLLLIGSLAACNGLSFLNSSATSKRTTQAAAKIDPANMSIEAKVGIGILKLEGTDQAIDAAKAKELLPLFRALKALSSNNNTAVDEITALNKQIKNSLTSEQLSAIQNMTFTAADIQTLMASYGSADTGTASNNSSRASSSQGGGMGGPPPDVAFVQGMSGPGGGVTTGSTTKVQVTPNAAAALVIARKSAGGLNLTFVDAIIELLQSKIA
jgi:hypothetical protein